MHCPADENRMTSRHLARLLEALPCSSPLLLSPTQNITFLFSSGPMSSTVHSLEERITRAFIFHAIKHNAFKESKELGGPQDVTKPAECRSSHTENPTGFSSSSVIIPVSSLSHVFLQKSKPSVLPTYAEHVELELMASVSAMITTHQCLDVCSAHTNTATAASRLSTINGLYGY